jgi:hypothetical protein
MSSNKKTIFKKIKEALQIKIEIAMEKHNQMLRDQKNDAIAYLNKPLTEDEVCDINIDIMANSAGWLGGDWTETDIKLHFLNHHSYLFDENEYLYYYDLITTQNAKYYNNPNKKDKK